VTGEAKGLSYYLLNMLNEKAGDSYNFALRIVPRARLDLITHNWHYGDCHDPEKNCEDNWIVIWVNPHWGFGKDPMKHCSYIPILDDSNSIISLIEHKVEYSKPESLIGLKLGGMLGHKYVGIDDLVQKALITRIDGTKERDNIFKLIKKRVDVILLPTSTAQYFISKDEIISKHASELYIAPTKHQEYRRNFMVPKTRVDITKFLESVDLSSDSWKTQLRNSGLINGD
jgi:polar amino acid transport system substrate-binding protein